MTPSNDPLGLPPETDAEGDEGESGLPAPVCVITFNGQDPSGAGGLAADVATISAMGGHACPVVSCIWVRDTTEVLGHLVLDPEMVVAQARMLLRDMDISGFKAGFLGSPEVVRGVSELIAEYPDIPLVVYLPEVLGWEEDTTNGYISAVREHLIPRAALLSGSHEVLTQFLAEPGQAAPASGQLPTPSELALQAHRMGASRLLVTGLASGAHAAGGGSFIDNVLLSVNADGQVEHGVREQFERIDMNFIGTGDTLGAAVATLLASGTDPNEAVSESLQFLDQSLETGYRLGMGSAIPDRFFWAVPPDDEGEPGEMPLEAEGEPSEGDVSDADLALRRQKAKRLH
ncbi:bifunctional hydroxymethylpyrimidine kinase/phosphomethylpyrimidine kinase [Amphibiibacter pelophylacis]|uniref:Bifunctional hydroxymethylpyrimidine kinase/phosphomethylpyrimidine kinase n=1 Tax=Amphibiibacter pelophylacis TaxID=1799477 RepID=A0ACC6NZ36_9BURK